jgi:hypothetical protein
MPPRWLSWAIIAFWLSMTGWLAYQQYSLRLRSGEPPPFTIDLTDEVGANEIAWNVLLNDNKMGQAYSSVKFDRRQRLFAFKSMVRFNDPVLAKLLGKVESMYRVNPDGELVDFELNQVREISPEQKILEGTVVSGHVEKGTIQPHVWVITSGKKIAVDYLIKLPEIKVARHLLNPMHLVNKVSGLREGLEWPIQLLEIKVGGNHLTRVNAKVSGVTLSWHGQDVSCFVIEYREPRKQHVHARTWVRRRDGLVLQQEAELLGLKLLSQREKERKP